MTKLSKNYREGKAPPLLAEYVEYAFAYKRPLIDGGGKRVGHRIIPADDTPRIFRDCNLVNCIPPPGSTLIHCNTTIVEIEEKPRPIEVGDAHEDVIYGRTNPDTLKPEYRTVPLKVPAKVHP